MISRRDSHHQRLSDLHRLRTDAGLDAIHPDEDHTATARMDLIADDCEGRLALIRLDGPNDDHTTAMAVHVDPRTLAAQPDDDLRLGRDAIAHAGQRSGDISWWIERIDRTAVDSAATDLGLERQRILLQMRRPLPLAPTDATAATAERSTPSITTRPFTDADEAAWLAVNNEAFAWHPDQAGMTPDRLDELLANSWVVSDGLRVLDAETDGPSALDGFCFNRIHAGHEPVLGEIYVVAVAAQARGRGLGQALTVDGLDWLYQHGAEVAMLYVEADNTRALATYGALGFSTHQINGVLGGGWP